MKNWAKPTGVKAGTHGLVERGRGRKGLYEFGFGAVLAIGCKLEYELERGNTGDEGLVAESVAEETDNSEGDLVRNAVSVVEGGTR